jgi:hypothetical protein
MFSGHDRILMKQRDGFVIVAMVFIGLFALTVGALIVHLHPAILQPK